MRGLVIGAVALLFSGAAQAQTCCSGLNSITVCCGDYRPPGCDSNEKTPAESLQCKLDYWRKEVTRIQEKKADIEKDLTKAQERVQAFTDAQRK